MLSMTHWLLAGNIMEAIDSNYKCALGNIVFKIGSVLPDLLPTSLLSGHNKDDSMSRVRALERRLRMKPSHRRPMDYVLMNLRLGMVCHYICDFFCRAHNEAKFMAIGTHLAYEQKLDRESRCSKLAQALANPDCKIARDINSRMSTGIDRAINCCHADYLKVYGGCEVDIHYSINVAYVIISHFLKDKAVVPPLADLSELAA